MNLEPEFISLIKSSIKKHLPEAQIFIFGSRATSTNSKFSDIDIAIKDKNLTPNSLALAKFDLEESILPYKVDLVNFYDLDVKVLINAVKI